MPHAPIGLDGDESWQFVCELSAFDASGVSKATLDGRPVGLFREGDEVFALDDICTHGNACLSEGLFEDGMVECPLHAGLFEVRTGKAMGAPVTRDARCYEVAIRDGLVFVKRQA